MPFTMTLKEMLEHLKDLTENGMEKSDAFSAAFDEYHRATTEPGRQNQISEAILFLAKNPDSLGSLNTECMAEQLEELEKKLCGY